MSVLTVKNKPKIYGLTGGIASGKSSVANYLIDNGILVFDSDLAVKSIWQDNESLINHIKNKYDIDILSINGKKKLSKLLFSNKDIRNEIESLIHPIVFKMIDEWIEENKNEKFLIIDMPLLYEVSYHLKVDKTILVYANYENNLHRLMKRDKISEEDAKKKIDSQIPLRDKYKLADIIIDNNNSITSLKNKVDLLIKELEDESK